MKFQHLFGLGESSWGSSTIFSRSLCDRYSFFLSLKHNFTLKLSYGANEIEQQFSRWTRCVQIHIENAKCGFFGLDGFSDLYEVWDRTG